MNNHTVIGEVLTRCQRIRGVDEVVCAIPYVDNEELGKVAAQYGPVYRGGVDDVLGRHWGAASAYRADVVVRVTGDCPLICPELCGEVIQALPGHDYASNIEPRTFPQGYDCEAFTYPILCRANLEADPSDREHVTTWMRRADIRRVNVASPWQLDGRLTLDTEDDYRVICAAFGHQPFERVRATAAA